MYRLISDEFDVWLRSSDRRPLVIRGARQVGKTWLVRDLAQRHGLELVEVNFERDPGLDQVFGGSSPRQVLDDLGLLRGKSLDPNACILFLDEIQARPALLAKLRWFAEELPQLAVVAAGSLLEFALSEHSFSMPVGRVTYRFVEPLNFVEFLHAHGEGALLQRLGAFDKEDELSPAVHARAKELYSRFSMVGGMPASVVLDVGGASAREIRRLQADLTATYRDDFAKYAGRLDTRVLDLVLTSVATQLGAKFVYARTHADVKHVHAKVSLELLAMSRVITLACHSAASGIPLAGAVELKKRKALFLDVGIAHALMRTPAEATFPSLEDLAPDVRGRLTEQLAGQELRAMAPGTGDEPVLHYWQRDGGRPGEIDYLVEIDQVVVPVELKAGAAGSMKSLHQFMHDKELGLALRVDTNPPSVMQVDVSTTQGDPARYTLISLPGYLLWRAKDLVRSAAADSN